MRIRNFNGITALTDDRGFVDRQVPVVREQVRYSVKVPKELSRNNVSACRYALLVMNRAGVGYKVGKCVTVLRTESRAFPLGGMVKAYRFEYNA